MGMEWSGDEMVRDELVMGMILLEMTWPWMNLSRDELVGDDIEGMIS